MLPQLALPQIEALHLLVESAFLTDTESRVPRSWARAGFNCPGAWPPKAKTLDSRLTDCGNDGPLHFPALVGASRRGISTAALAATKGFDPESRVFNWPGEESTKDSGLRLLPEWRVGARPAIQMWHCRVG